jgi:hypothetical protein
MSVQPQAKVQVRRADWATAAASVKLMNGPKLTSWALPDCMKRHIQSAELPRTPRYKPGAARCIPSTPESRFAACAVICIFEFRQ